MVSVGVVRACDVVRGRLCQGYHLAFFVFFVLSASKLEASYLVLSKTLKGSLVWFETPSIYRESYTVLASCRGSILEMWHRLLKVTAQTLETHARDVHCDAVHLRQPEWQGHIVELLREINTNGSMKNPVSQAKPRASHLPHHPLLAVSLILGF